MTNPTVVVHGQVRELRATELTDAQVASSVFMCNSGVNPHELLNAHTHGTKQKFDSLALQMAMPEIGRDRILYLSQRLERAEALLKKLATYEAYGVHHDELNAFLAEHKTVPSVEPDLMKRK